MLALSVIQSQLLRAVAGVITGNIMPALCALSVGVNCCQPGDRNPVSATPIRPTTRFRHWFGRERHRVDGAPPGKLG